MNKLILVLALCLPFCLGACSACKAKIETVDVNKDGKPDVVYHHDGENIHKIEADTNYDGINDVTVYVEEGKFKKAEVDTDYDGVVDKKFDDAAQFKEWVNDKRPDFNDSLGWDDYSRKINKVFWKPGGKTE